MRDEIARELHALLVRASITEAARQAAKARGDTRAETALADELRQLWRQHAELKEHAA